MPLVNIKVLKEDDLPAVKKAELIANVTKAVAETLGKNPAATWVTRTASVVAPPRRCSATGRG